MESPAYAYASFATESFFEERFNPQNAVVTFDETGTYILPQNFDGEWINVVNHQRLTSGQPEAYDHTVYLFGGSTLFNVEVPDEQTVASKLQSLLSEAYGETYKVVNLGVIGASTSQQLAHLKTLSLEPGDVVVFFDGINDVVKNLSYQGSQLARILEKSHLIKYFIMPLFRRWLPGYQLNQTDIETTYYENIKTACSMTQAAGADFLHFLQPNIYMDESPTIYEKTLIESLENDYPGWKNSILQGYKQLASAQEKLSDEGLPSYDWRFILTDHEDFDPHEIYLDDVHVNQIGNQIIAEALFAAIQNDNNSQ
jgi:lysophospholipase L1-like esterase